MTGLIRSRKQILFLYNMSYLKKELYELIKSNTSIFDFIQDNSLDGLWYRDIENPENEWTNHGFWLNFGYTPDEIQYKTFTWQNIIHPDDLKSATYNLNKHCEDPNHPYNLVLRYTHQNGSTVWMRCRGMAIRNNAGKAIRMLGTHTNITKEKENEERNNILFNSIDQGFCIIEMLFDEHTKPVDYRFVMINTSFEKQTGLCNVVGKRMRELAPAHEDHWFEIYGKVALTGESIRFENRAEQLHRWYDVYAFRFGEPKDRQVAILFNDITERKQSEETIRLLNKELAYNLHQIESSNKELESFSYSVSHDLHAPLRSINNYAKILEEDFSEFLPPEAKKHLDVICKNSQKMRKLIDDILSLSRVSKKDIEKKYVDAEAIVRNAIEEVCSGQLMQKGIFSVRSLPPAYGDAILLTQVWINLISNACKYSKNNAAPAIEIGASEKNNESFYYIKDNGTGFDMNYYDKLFGVFQRLHSDDEFEGTGVGLAIVQRIVERHGGRVWAEGKVNEGACFYFTIPIMQL
jgi:PAS domain S-box-containing protein